MPVWQKGNATPRVRRRDEREARREHKRAARAGERDLPELEHFAQRFQRAALELGKLVEEEYAVVSE